MKTIGIIGFGNMGSAIALALAESGGYRLAIADSDEAKTKPLKKKALTSTDPNAVVAASDVVILATKPQSFEELARSLTVSSQKKLFISIMAGVKIEKMAKLLKTDKIVRTMPNLPALAQAGLTGVYFPPQISATAQNTVRKILAAFSFVVEVKKEADLNKITALSGSGPAYFFALTQFLEEQARAFGFSEAEARIIAETTFLGSAQVFSEGEKTAADWVKAVASKGGTTEAALKTFDEKGLDKAFKAGIEAARRRAEEL